MGYRTPAISDVAPGYSVSLAERLSLKCREDAATGCWVWTGPRDRKGYGRIKVGRRETGTHRAAWLAYRGDIPEGLVIDHLCRVRACANPWHMELVTIRVNTERAIYTNPSGKQPGRPRGRACINGHAFAEHGAERRRGKSTVQICLICERQRTARWKARHRAA